MCIPGVWIQSSSCRPSVAGLESPATGGRLVISRIEIARALRRILFDELHPKTTAEREALADLGGGLHQNTYVSISVSKRDLGVRKASGVSASRHSEVETSVAETEFRWWKELRRASSYS